MSASLLARATRAAVGMAVHYPREGRSLSEIVRPLSVLVVGNGGEGPLAAALGAIRADDPEAAVEALAAAPLAGGLRRDGGLRAVHPCPEPPTAAAWFRGLARLRRRGYDAVVLTAPDPSVIAAALCLLPGRKAVFFRPDSWREARLRSVPDIIWRGMGPLSAPLRVAGRCAALALILLALARTRARAVAWRARHGRRGSRARAPGKGY
ncbi:MAG: hypothetical protein PHN82_04330 [bacterium]|nr:hypothetical protein [bacterium]